MTCPECKLDYIDEKTYNTEEFVRFTPIINFSHESIKVDQENQVVHVQCLQDFYKSSKNKGPHYWSFPVEGIFRQSCQEEVYTAVCADLIGKLLDGKNAMIIMIGQTKSGKTLSMSGLRHQYENRGIILRFLSDLFEERERRKCLQDMRFRISYVECHRGGLVDLLTMSSPVHKNTKNIRQVEVDNEFRSWQVLFEGEFNKTTDMCASYSGANLYSSIFTVYIMTRSKLDTDPTIRYSKVHFLDLAGIDIFGTTAKSKLIVGHANSSKSFMEQFILCMRRTQRKCDMKHVCGCDYRSNKLINYVYDTLTPSCLVRLVTHLKGAHEDLRLTLSLLRFGEKLRCLKPSKVIQVMQEDCEVNKRLLELQVLHLKDELERIAMFGNRDNYTTLSQDQYQQIKRAVAAYLEDKIGELTLFSMQQATAIVQIFKEFYVKSLEDREDAIQKAILETLGSISTLQGSERRHDTSVSSQRSKRRSTSNVKRSSSKISSTSSKLFQRNSSQIVSEPGGDLETKSIVFGTDHSNTSYEGSVVKALKQSRCSTEALKYRNASLSQQSAAQVFSAEPQEELELPENIPTRKEIIDDFFRSQPELADSLEKNIDECLKAVSELQRKYLESISNIKTSREELNNLREQLEKAEHINLVMGSEVVTDSNTIIANEFEEKIMKQIKEKEHLVEAEIEEAHVVMAELRETNKSLINAKNEFEKQLEVFSRNDSQFVSVPEEPIQFPAEEENQIQTTPVEQVDDIDVTRSNTFYHMQNMMFMGVRPPLPRRWIS